MMSTKYEPIEEKFLLHLKNAGLHVSKPYKEGHSLENGVLVGKPISTKGNSLPDFEIEFHGELIDAPPLYFYSTGHEWIVCMQEGIPDFAPGDFLNTWKKPEEAVEDILDFYLGNSERMKVKIERQKQFQDRLAVLHEGE